MKNYIELKLNVHDNKVDGIIWQSWDSIVWTWRLCVPGYTYFWYDGPHRIISLGIGSLYFGHGNNYLEKHNI